MLDGDEQKNPNPFGFRVRVSQQVEELLLAPEGQRATASRASPFVDFLEYLLENEARVNMSRIAQASASDPAMLPGLAGRVAMLEDLRDMIESKFTFE